jgi:hypothetical protein
MKRPFQEVQASIERRKQIKRDYLAFYEELLQLLAHHDPVGLLAIGAPKDEYEPEVGTILPRLVALAQSGSNSVPAIRKVIYEEFSRWFGSDIAGPEERYHSIAEELCNRLLSDSRLLSRTTRESA